MVSRRVLAHAFVEELLKAPEKRPALIRSLAAYLLEAKHIKQLDLVMGDIAKELAARGHVTAEVVSAAALTDEARAAIKQFILEKTGATTTELTEKTDPSLIGGIRLTLPHHQLDTSVKKQLEQLKRA